MKIPFIEFKNHPILGNLELDFRKNCEEVISVCRDDDPTKTNTQILVPTPQKGNQYSIILDQDNIYDYILFVGENGVGKTTILNEINDYNNSKFIDYAYNKFNVEFHGNVKGQKVFGFPGDFYSSFLERDIKYNEGRLAERTEIYKTGMESPNYVFGDMVSWLNIRNLSVEKLNNIFNNGRLAEAYEAAQKFQNPHSVRATTREELFGKPDTMIDYIKELSSGEQEILLRILYFFKHPLSKLSDNCLIDEPETGLHPKWQLRILEYYKEIFQDQIGAGYIGKDGVPIPPPFGKQKLQLFIASHSENILKSAIEQGDWLIIRLFRDEAGKIKGERVESSERRLPALTFAETQYIVFGIPSRDYHNELYGYLQNKLKKSVKGIDSWIVMQAAYENQKHGKLTSYKGAEYQTICTYIRNEIDHPPIDGTTFSREQLQTSIELLRALIKQSL